MKISAAIITYNEQENIAPYLDMLSFVDEIIFVDSYSTDNTIKIAEQYPQVKIYFRKFDDFTSQKNYALSLAKNDWVLFFDADERIDEKFIQEINNILKNPYCGAYRVKRIFYIKDEVLNYSGFQNDYAVRLINKNFCKYTTDKKVHEEIYCSKKIGEINTPIIHYSFKDVDSFRNKLNLYSKSKAKELYEKKVQPNFFHCYIKPYYRFFHHYFLKLGFLDGKNGLMIANLFKDHVKMRYIYLKELYNNNN